MDQGSFVAGIGASPSYLVFGSGSIKSKNELLDFEIGSISYLRSSAYAIQFLAFYGMGWFLGRGCRGRIPGQWAFFLFQNALS